MIDARPPESEQLEEALHPHEVRRSSSAAFAHVDVPPDVPSGEGSARLSSAAERRSKNGRGETRPTTSADQRRSRLVRTFHRVTVHRRGEGPVERGTVLEICGERMEVSVRLESTAADSGRDVVLVRSCERPGRMRTSFVRALQVRQLWPVTSRVAAEESVSLAADVGGDDEA